MKEKNLKKFDILIKEYDERVVKQVGEDFEDAKSIVEDKINNEEIYLDLTTNYYKEILNYNSKNIDNPLKVIIEYDPVTRKTNIKSDDFNVEYNYGNTVRDLANDFTKFCKTYLEDMEIEAGKDLENEIEEEMEMI